jgi:hypothetical protein
MDALLKGADWAQTGTNSTKDDEPLSIENTTGVAIPLGTRALSMGGAGLEPATSYLEGGP